MLKSKTIGLIGGGFKPPTKGHLNMILNALYKNPQIDEIIIFVGGKQRDTISQADSIKIWNIYQELIPVKSQIIPTVSPIKLVWDYVKENPTQNILFILGQRGESQEDLKDIEQRTKGIKKKYPNVDIFISQTSKTSQISGTKARQALASSPKDFFEYLPEELSLEKKQEIYNILKPTPINENKIQFYKNYFKNLAPSGSDVDFKEGKITIKLNKKIIKENSTYSEYINLKEQVDKFLEYFKQKYPRFNPLPSIEFKNGDYENAQDFYGKTAYYDPNNKKIVLYTEGRHPKDIVRSLAHEMVHHKQNLEGRLNDVNTTNTNEDGGLEDIEKEAYLDGNMTFRNWTDSLNENLTKNSNQIYHWTSYSACKKIIESNELKSNKSSQFFEYDESRDLPKYKNVVFFTVENERFVDEENSNQCILVVDKSELSKDYKVISYGDPYEETVVYTDKKHIPIIPYLKGVLLMNTLQKSDVKSLVQFLELKNIPYEINDNLEKQVTAKKDMLPTLKKKLVNKLKLKYPNGFIGYLNTPLFPFQTPEYFQSNSTYSFPSITINKPGEYGEKNKFQVKFEIKPENLEKYINWFIYDPNSIEDLVNMDNYEGKEIELKGDIPIDTTSLQEANLTGNINFREWTDNIKNSTQLNEIGDLSAESYSYKKSKEYINKYQEKKTDFEFETSSGLIYHVQIIQYYNVKKADMAFSQKDGDFLDITNKGELFSIMSTIVKIMKEYIGENQDLKTFTMDAAKNYDDDYRRLKLYIEYIKKNIPTGWEYEYNNKGEIELTNNNIEEKKGDRQGIKAFAYELIRELVEEQPQYQIYSDMDGVITDFDSKFKSLSNDIPPSEYEQKYGKEKFWKLISDKGVGFWVGMKWMPDGKEYWDYIKQFNPKLLSAPSRDQSSRLGKRLWVKNNIPETELILRSADKKREFASPTSILIDDREFNINQWRQDGGIGILHTSAQNTIKELKKLGL